MPYPANPEMRPAMSNADYHADRTAVSASMLAELARTPRHFQYRYLRPDAIPEPPTEAELTGEAVHMAVLEPERFAAWYEVKPDCDRRTKEGKAAYADYRAMLQTTGKAEITAEDRATALAVAQEVRQYPLGQRLLCGPAKREVSVFWTDAETGVRCRIRPDCVPEAHPVMVDLKSTKDASEFPFTADAWRYGYHVRAAMYLAGWRALTGESREYTFAAWEKEPPYLSCWYYVEDELLEFGRKQFSKMLKLYAKCQAKNEWPAYPNELQSLMPPPWAQNKRS